MTDDRDNDIARILDAYVPPDGWAGARDWRAVRQRAQSPPRVGGRIVWLTAGAAVVAFAAIAVTSIGGLRGDRSASSGTSPTVTGTVSSPPEPSAFLRDARTDAVAFRVMAPGEFKHAKPGDQCLEFNVAGELPNYLCGQPAGVRQDGFVGTLQRDDSQILVYGVRPERSDHVRIAGTDAPISEDGPLFSTLVAPDVKPLVEFLAQGSVIHSTRPLGASWQTP